MENAFFLATFHKIYRVLTDKHVPTLACILNVLQLLVSDLCELLQILCLFYLLCIALQLLRRVNTDYAH